MLLAIVFAAGDDRFNLEVRAPSIAAADRGVVAFPLASVCVIKSGIATGSAAAGVLGIPGDRRSLPPRTPFGVGGLRCSLVLVSTVRFGL